MQETTNLKQLALQHIQRKLTRKQEGNLQETFKPEKFQKVSSLNLKLSRIVRNLKPCPLCNGLDFIHGHNGGYFCIKCQPNARPGIPVKAEAIQ